MNYKEIKLLETIHECNTHLSKLNRAFTSVSSLYKITQKVIKYLYKSKVLQLDVNIDLNIEIPSYSKWD